MFQGTVFSLENKTNRKNKHNRQHYLKNISARPVDADVSCSSDNVLEAPDGCLVLNQFIFFILE